jgi:polyribonucleotide nucleotidyltransferase
MSHFTCYHRGVSRLQVEYREPVASVGRMPGGRAKTEGGPNQSEEDTALLIEKAILPLFAPGFTQNVTVSSSATMQDSPML